VRKPNFFIIGAPKCGTTSLAAYLREHPRVFFPARKAPHFFNTDMMLRNVRSQSDHYAYFDDAVPKHIAVGEGSVLYLYSDEAVPRILEAIPDSRFIVMVRNPIDMAVSWHGHLRFTGDENIRHLATAWRTQEARRSGRRIPAFCKDPSLLLYGRICSVGWQLKRIYSRVPRERLLVLLFDDLKRNAREVYLRTLEFLDVPDDGNMAFAVHNARQKPVRSYLLQVAFNFLNEVKTNSGIKRTFGILPVIHRLNALETEKEVLEPQFRAELVNYFRNDVEELSELISRDLSGWLRV
jgi:hypothetical protein